MAIAVFRQVSAKPVLVEKPAPEAQAASSPQVVSSPQKGPSAWNVVVPESPAAPEPQTAASRPQAQPQSRTPEVGFALCPAEAPMTRAGGILGTRDMLVFEEEPVAKVKKNWWRRFWEDDE